jgi:cation:H+ antiporter
MTFAGARRSDRRFWSKQTRSSIRSCSHRANLNPGVLSLVISPLVAELPEKYNSVLWIRQRKEHLALANITGAMVFQA